MNVNYFSKGTLIFLLNFRDIEPMLLKKVDNIKFNFV